MKPGTQLGPYEIREPLGKGGMGEVYLARDPELGRDVAIKLLPEELSDDEQRLARLRREARSLASLNHPGIAHVYGYEKHDSTRFIVMELVEGETLAEKLQGGPLSVEEALNLGIQIAKALEAAHERGIVHRDLKPSNVKVTPSGDVKVLDFGLAKAVRAETADSKSELPTATVEMTRTGTVLGTAPYMSPEQVRGEEVDERTDIWALGCTVYEMLTGRKAFAAETPSETLAAVLKEEPNWERLPTPLAPSLRRFLHRSLAKKLDNRLYHVADARLELEEALEKPIRAAPPAVGAAGDRVWWSTALIVVGAVVVGTLLALAWMSDRLSEPSLGVSYVHLNLEPGTHLWGGQPDEARIGSNRPSRTAFALTPDGRAVVYAATDGETGRLYLRRLGDSQAIPIGGTEGGSSPFLSPDGRQVGFVAGNEIKIVPVSGGVPRTVLSGAPLPSDGPYGLGWTDEWIVFSAQQGIYRVPAAGGAVEQLTAVRRDRDEAAHLQPTLLPGGAALLYTVPEDGTLRDLQATKIVAQPLDQGTDAEPIVLVRGGADARYSPSGHLLFGRWGTLMAAAFDRERLKLIGEPVPVVEDVMQAMNVSNYSIATGAVQFDFSVSGSLLYATGGIYPEVTNAPVWINRDGEVEPIPVPDWNYHFWYARVSPDGRQVAYRGPTFAERDIILLDLESGATNRLRLPGVQAYPVWSPDGTRIAFESNHESSRGLYSIASDLSGEPRRIIESEREPALSDWSVNDVLAFVRDRDIWMVAADGGAEPERFVREPGSQSFPTFSPDGKWLAYRSDESGRDEIYVRPYPAGVPVYQVTREGGTRPAWSRDGSELFYRTGTYDRSKMMAVAVDLGTEFRVAGSARELFDRLMSGTGLSRSYDVAPDGRFLMAEHWEPPSQPVTELILVLNWFEELERQVPPGK